MKKAPVSRREALKRWCCDVNDGMGLIHEQI